MQDAARDNHDLQAAEAILLRVESPLEAMRKPSFGDAFFFTTWPTSHNKCMKTVTDQSVEHVDDKCQFDSMANFRRPDGTVATTGALTFALATMVNSELQVLDSASGMHWADVVSVAHSHTNKNKKDSNFYVPQPTSEFRRGVKKCFSLVVGNPNYSTIWAQGSDVIRALQKESREASNNCIITRANSVMLVAFGLKEPDVVINWPCVKNSGVFLIKCNCAGQMSKRGRPGVSGTLLPLHYISYNPPSRGLTTPVY
jgi:hypothetical protein